jgi:hypothetical protein
MWAAAFVFYLGMQMVSRRVTPRFLNVNISHRIYDGLERFFPNYVVFWLTASGGGAAVLWGLDHALRFYFKK